MLPGSHKSAEPVEAGRVGTSTSMSGPAREPAMERETEPMEDASLQCEACQRGSGWVGRKAGGASVFAGITRTEGARAFARHRLSEPAGLERLNPHGVESAPKAGERSPLEPKNPVLASSRSALRRAEMTEATGDRGDGGQSLRSSPRTGKPSTWRREAVDAVSKQGVDLCPAR